MPAALLPLTTRHYCAHPCTAMPGLVEEALELPLEQTAFVPLHIWNVGFPDGPPVPPEYFVDMGLPETHALAEQIVKAWIRPATDAARAAGLPIFHVQPVRIADRYPQAQWLREDPPELVDRRPRSPEAIPGSRRGVIRSNQHGGSSASRSASAPA